MKYLKVQVKQSMYRFKAAFILSMVYLMGCLNPIDPNDNSKGVVIENFELEWNTKNGGAGGYWNDSPKNFKINFEVLDTQSDVGFEFTSSDLEFTYGIYDEFDKPFSSYSSGSKKLFSLGLSLQKGKYYLKIMSDNNAMGLVKAKISGKNITAKKVDNNILFFENEAFDQNGGGGTFNSAKNHFYTFEVIENNQYVDIEQSSSDFNIYFKVFGPNLVEIKDSNTGRKYGRLTLKLNKGIYTVMACTNIRNDVGKYTIRVSGLIGNLKKEKINNQIITGTFSNAKDRKIITIEITDASVYYDFNLETTGANSGLELKDNLGNSLKRERETKSPYLYGSLKKGVYKLELIPYASNNYVLKNYGNFVLL